MSSSAAAYQKEKREKLDALKEKAGIATKSTEKSLARKIAESSLYDWHPQARFLLTQLAVLAMDEDSEYPKDAPEKYHDDKEGWCWMSQFKLALRVGCSEDAIGDWIARFREDGVILYRDWYDENKTPHAEYKVVESVVDALQRPSQKRGVERKPRYADKRKANAGSFSTVNQPGRSAQRKAIMEEDGE
jgi:hypothetical protein